VQGEILFEPSPPDLARATVRVRLEDTSLLDAPAQVAAEQVISNLEGRLSEGEGIPFALYGSPPDPRASYSLSVHADVDGTGKIDPGDYINVQSYPVLTYGHPDRVTVHVRRIEPRGG
jgi:uncharacterized lipoprotein YbaY